VQNAESSNHSAKHKSNQAEALTDDDGLVQSIESMQSVLHRRYVEAKEMLEKAFRTGQSVSRDYATALDVAISKVAGVQCNVHGTYTITPRQDDPLRGECVYLVAHATPRKRTVFVEYKSTGYTATYSEPDLTSQHDGVRVAAIEVGAQVLRGRDPCESHGQHSSQGLLRKRASVGLHARPESIHTGNRSPRSSLEQLGSLGLLSRLRRQPCRCMQSVLPLVVRSKRVSTPIGSGTHFQLVLIIST
jgi:hypothetical protein